jgi:hypothetical protein
VDQPGIRVQLEELDHRVQLDLVVKVDQPVKPETLAHLVQLEIQVQQVQPV